MTFRRSPFTQKGQIILNLGSIQIYICSMNCRAKQGEQCNFVPLFFSQGFLVTATRIRIDLAKEAGWSTNKSVYILQVEVWVKQHTDFSFLFVMSFPEHLHPNFQVCLNLKLSRHFSGRQPYKERSGQKEKREGGREDFGIIVTYLSSCLCNVCILHP